MSHNLLGMLATLHTLHAELSSPCLVESLRRLTFVGVSASRTATGATHGKLVQCDWMATYKFDTKLALFTNDLLTRLWRQANSHTQHLRESP